MRRRQPVPRLWLMTDERLGGDLWNALDRLPRGAGVVFRHYSLSASARGRMFAKVLRIARRRGLVLVRAGPMPMRGEMGVHNGRGEGLVTRSVHSRRELMATCGVDAVFVSPVFATRSHPERRALGAVRLGLLMHDAGVPVIALGGMNASRFRRLAGFGLHGWAGIDAWAGDRRVRETGRVRVRGVL